MKLITITGPSGAGKDTVARMLSEMGGYKVLCSYTTRPKREGEIDGVEHYFVEKCDVPHDKMLAYTQYGGYEYWTTIDQVTDKAIYVIDEDGLRALCKKIPDIELFKICVSAKEGTRLRRGVSQERMDRDKKRKRLPLSFFNAVIFNNDSPSDLQDEVQRVKFMFEHKNLMDALSSYNVSEDEFIEKAQKYECEEAFSIIRMTLVVTTQRIQGESYNRKSPNCIAEQSTRYVNLSRKGGVQICRPHWEAQAKWYQLWTSHFGYWVAEKVYKFLIFTGLKPEDARGNLTFNTYTICGYTYTLHEWKHILDMRLRNKTGIAHPDASIVAKQISRIINDRMQQYIPSFEI